MVHSFAYNKKGELRGNFVPLLGSWLAGWLRSLSLSGQFITLCKFILNDSPDCVLERDVPPLGLPLNLHKKR